MYGGVYVCRQTDGFIGTHNIDVGSFDHGLGPLVRDVLLCEFRFWGLGLRSYKKRSIQATLAWVLVTEFKVALLGIYSKPSFFNFIK